MDVSRGENRNDIKRSKKKPSRSDRNADPEGFCAARKYIKQRAALRKFKSIDRQSCTTLFRIGLILEKESQGSGAGMCTYCTAY